MTFSKQKQDNRKIAAKIGFWSAILATILNIWFYIAYGLYQSIQLAPWHGLTDYVESFQPFPLLVWVVPCLILAPIILIMVSCLHFWVDEDKRIWSFFAVIFSIIYTTLVSLNYYIQLTVVQYNLINRNAEGLSLWLYAYPYPRSFPGAFEGVAYGFMCISWLFAAQAFSNQKLQKWTQRLFIGTGITGLVVFIDPIFRLPMAFLMVDGVFGAIFLSLATVFLAIVFWRDLYSSRSLDTNQEIR